MNGNAVGTYTPNSYVQALNTNVAGTRDVANYVKWTGVAADNDGKLIFNFNGTSGSAAITGFQIVSVPEPSTAMFVGAMGVIGLLRRRR